MVEYRVYLLGDVKRFTCAEVVEAVSDEEATRQARKLMQDFVRCEVWKGDRLVARMSADEVPE